MLDSGRMGLKEEREKGLPGHGLLEGPGLESRGKGGTWMWSFGRSRFGVFLVGKSFLLKLHQ